jgi:hypothetical protein
MLKCLDIISLLVLVCYTQGNLFAQRFTAYYTKIGDDYDILEAVDERLFGKYADLIVEVKDLGKILFTRKTSYLPVWKTNSGEYPFDEIVDRKGDGRGNRPDIISKYSYVRLIEKNPDEILVHWRYFPDFRNVRWDGVVDEYFSISPEGKVIRSIREGTKKYLDWIDLANTTYKTYELISDGIKVIKNEKLPLTFYNEFEPIAKLVLHTIDRNNLLKFSFDEGRFGYSDKTKESISGKELAINGPHSYWKEGISGSALHFDGYYSSIEINNYNGNSELKSFTVAGWIALGAYPFGWAPIMQQSEWGREGFYFGINEEGYPGFHVAIDGDWISLIDSNRIELSEWNYVAAVYAPNEHTLSLYKNGELSTSKKVSGKSFTSNKSVLTFGLNRQYMPPIEGRIRRGKWPSMFGIDGLIDEVNIYGKALSSTEIKDMYNVLSVGIDICDMDIRKLPAVRSNFINNKFGAHYTTLKYYETWDNLWRVSDHADVVVTFDELPVNIVSWRGISYGHYFVTENGKWIGDQSNEDYRHVRHPGEAEGCLEHMSDKQCRHSHVRIIENTDARVLIHWRYGLVDSRYKFAPGVDGWGGWTDEYWTIYPDGIAIRHVPRGIVFGDGWVEIMFLSEPGTVPEDNVHLQAFSIMNIDGEVENLSWENNSPESQLNDPILTMVNSKSEYKMFNIFPTGSSIEIFGGHSKRSHFHWWNHWPVSQITSDGRGARASDRLAHSSLSWGAPSTNFLMYGISTKDLKELLPLAKNWNNNPEIKDISGCSDSKYIQEERAYHIYTKSANVVFDLNVRNESPLVNPAFVFHNWKGDDVELSIDDKSISKGKDFRSGFIDTPNGKNLVVWLDYYSSSKTRFEFSSTKENKINN